MDNQDKIEISKSELILMLTQYWALDNNENCEAGTRIFLERNNISDILDGWKDITEFSEPTKSDREFYLDELQEIKDYKRLKKERSI